MRLKLKDSILSIILLCLGFVIFGCVEEPPITPVKRPFSEVRVLNLSQNVDGMRVTIDDSSPNSALNGLTIPSSTGYFDVNSGDRNFKVYDNANNLIFEKTITINSYERVIVVFTGFYSTDLLLNTFSTFNVAEGYVYVSFAPSPGTSRLYLINAAATYDTIESRDYTKVRAFIPTSTGGIKDTTYIKDTAPASTPLTFESVFPIDSAFAGNYDFTFFGSVKNVKTDTTAMPTFTLSSNMRGYVFIYGVPNNIQFFNYEIVPPPSRSRE